MAGPINRLSEHAKQMIIDATQVEHSEGPRDVLLQRCKPLLPKNELSFLGLVQNGMRQKPRNIFQNADASVLIALIPYFPVTFDENEDDYLDFLARYQPNIFFNCAKQESLAIKKDYNLPATPTRDLRAKINFILRNNEEVAYRYLKYIKTQTVSDVKSDRYVAIIPRNAQLRYISEHNNNAKKVLNRFFNGFGKRLVHFFFGSGKIFNFLYGTTNSVVSRVLRANIFQGAPAPEVAPPAVQAAAPAAPAPRSAVQAAALAAEAVLPGAIEGEAQAVAVKREGPVPAAAGEREAAAPVAALEPEEMAAGAPITADATAALVPATLEGEVAKQTVATLQEEEARPPVAGSLSPAQLVAVVGSPLLSPANHVAAVKGNALSVANFLPAAAISGSPILSPALLPGSPPARHPRRRLSFNGSGSPLISPARPAHHQDADGSVLLSPDNCRDAVKEERSIILGATVGAQG